MERTACMKHVCTGGGATRRASRQSKKSSESSSSLFLALKAGGRSATSMSELLSSEFPQTAVCETEYNNNTSMLEPLPFTVIAMKGKDFIYPHLYMLILVKYQFNNCHLH